MKIRVITTLPCIFTCPDYLICTIDEFVELFVRDHQLVIGELQVQIANFVKHSQYIATFDVENVVMEPELVAEGMCPYRYALINILLARGAGNAINGMAYLHNVHFDCIPDDINPLKNSAAGWKCNKFVKFVGKFLPLNLILAKPKKDLICIIEKIVHEVEEDLRLLDDSAPVQLYINSVIMSLVDWYKDDYADARKELLDLGIETISGNYLFDVYFDKKYGGSR